MDLNTIVEIVRSSSWAELKSWDHGDAWLAGGTWLFSEPQPELTRLIDLDAFGWAPLTVGDDGLQIAATCKIADLYGFQAPESWLGAPLFRQCCDALLASFKIWNMATVGGNLCLSLPAGAIISLTTALGGICTLWQRDGTERQLPITDFVTGIRTNSLLPGEVMRSILLPVTELRKQTAFRQISRSELGRSSVLLIGTVQPDGNDFSLAITAATTRPMRLIFESLPDPDDLHSRLDDAIPDDLYFADMHGSTDYRRRMTFFFAEEIRQELRDRVGA